MKKFVLSIGLFDKDTHTLLLDVDNARSLLDNEVARRFDGGTTYGAMGVYRHASGELVQEPTLRVELLDTTQEAVLSLIEWAKAAFNQESVLEEIIEEQFYFI